MSQGPQTQAVEPDWWDENLAPAWRPKFDLLLEAAETLGARFIKVGTSLGQPLDNLDFLVELLRRLTAEAALRGTRIALDALFDGGKRAGGC